MNPVVSGGSELMHSPTPENVPLDLHRSPQPSNSEISETNITPENLNKSLDKSTESRDSKKSPAESASPVKNRRKRKPNVTKKVSAAEIIFSENDTEGLNVDIPVIDIKTNVISSEEVRKSTESDDCETIDKIAQMVSNITSNSDQTLPLNESDSKLQNDELIESQLEQMFADSKDGEAPPADPSVPDSTSIPIQSESPKENKKKKPQAKPRKKKVDGTGPSGRKKQPPASLAKLKNGKSGKKKIKANDTTDQNKSEVKTKTKENGGKSKVKPDVAPFVQIQKDGSFSIVNQAANGDDDTEKSVNKSKKGPNTDKHKVIRGLHVSTLSNKYDADKRDATWICVFCKLGPHKHKLGDLFGPYIISKTSEDYSLCLEDPANDIFRQKNKNKFTKVPPTLPTPEKSKKKRKMNDSSAKSLPATTGAVAIDEIFAGMTKVDDNNFEVWFHEDCIVWANGVYIIGTKIIGMEASIWSCTRYRCVYCSKNGAMLSCLSRDCNKTSHVYCARKGWKLDEDFKTFCELHH